MEAIINKFDKKEKQIRQNQKQIKRQDFKFLTSKEKTEEILNSLIKDFYISTHNQENILKYKNEYFESNCLKSFKEHNQGKHNRSKQRIRHYLNGHIDSYFEKKIKIKGLYINKLREKKTNKIPDWWDKSLNKKLFINYKRVHLIHKTENIRVTIDFDITTSCPTKNIKIPLCKNHYILEVKSPKRPINILRSLLKTHKLRPIKFSKYCIGVIQLNQNLPSNNWKQTLKKIDTYT